jgi:hypothetical protein
MRGVDGCEEEELEEGKNLDLNDSMVLISVRGCLEITIVSTHLMLEHRLWLVFGYQPSRDKDIVGIVTNLYEPKSPRPYLDDFP